MIYSSISVLAGARGIEPRSQVLETRVLTVVLCPYDFNIVSDRQLSINSSTFIKFLIFALTVKTLQNSIKIADISWFYDRKL